MSYESVSDPSEDSSSANSVVAIELRIRCLRLGSWNMASSLELEEISDSSMSSILIVLN